ncbi:MAG: hypothetical protein GY950_37660 [bacterium]|nr:hypothetical protein [bacterium]
MEKLLLYIKHHIKFLWRFLESLNAAALKIRFGKRINAVKEKHRGVTTIGDNFQYRLLSRSDLDSLHAFLNSLDKSYLTFFSPHGFDKKTLARILKTSVYIPLGWFSEGRLVGYFFLRLFANKKAFTGRVVAADFQGRGIAKDMARILYRSSDEMDFDVFGTMSRKNLSSYHSHKAVSDFKIVKELSNDYMLVQYDRKNIR